MERYPVLSYLYFLLYQILPTMLNNIVSKPELLWFVIGLLLFLLELVLPGFVIFFFGVGAWITALVCLVFNPGTNLQILIFAVTSVLSLVLLRRMIQRKILYGRKDTSSEVEDEFTGREAKAITDIAPGKAGKVEFKGTTWNAECETPVNEGDTVIITGKESFKLFVKPKNN